MEKSNAIDSEIALTAFLATTVSVIQVPEFEYSQFIPILGVTLLFTTLIRRILLVENKSNNSQWMMLSNPVLYICSSISAIYILYAFSTYTASNTTLPPDLQPLLFALTISVIGYLCLLIRPNVSIYEIDRMLGGHIEIADGKIAEQIASFSQKEIEQVEQQPTSPGDPAIVSWIIRCLILTVAFLGIVGISTYYVLPEFYSLYVYFILFMGVLSIYVFAMIWYSRYGVLRYEDLLEARLARYLTVFGLIFTCIFSFLVI